MARYGNSGGRNLGKKYKKLTGFEIATDESEAKARAFMQWYGDNFEKLKRELYYKGRHFDDQIATDTALIIYDAIALKGAEVASPKHYFFRAYHTNALKVTLSENYEAELTEVLGARAPTFDYAEYERVVDELNREILDYVRAKYPPFECSIFEIYIGLQPDTSYKKLSALLQIPVTKIWTAIGAIRKDLGETFKDKKDYLLTLT